MTDQTGRTIERGHRARIQIKRWIMREKGLASSALDAEIKAITPRAVLVEATATLDPADHCHRCGREITHPGSRLIGYGPDCAEKLGMSRPEIDALDADTIEHVRTRLRTEGTFEGWIPVSQIETAEILGGEPVPPTPAETQRRRAREAVVLDLADGRIRAATPFRLKDAAKSVEGRRWEKAAKVWTYPASPTTAAALLDVFEGEEIRYATEEARTKIQGLLAALTARAEAQAAKHREDIPDIPTVRTEAWLHQRQAFEFAKDLPGAILHMHMGTGKTLATMGLIAYREAAVTIVLAPKRVIPVWPREFAKHVGTDGWEILPLSKGTTAKRAKATLEAAKAARATGRRLVVVVNYEAAWRGDLAKALEAIEPEVVVFDEIHRIKSPQGKASKFAHRLANLGSVRARYGLTGTLMPHGPLDVFAEVRAIDAGLFGDSWFRFRKRYAIEDYFGGIAGYQNLDDLQARLAQITYRAEKGVLDLPEVMHEEVEIEISPKARRFYDALETDLYAAWEEGEISVSNTLTKLLRLQQITSGYARLDDDEDGDLIQVDTGKRDALAEILDDLSEPVVVFSVYTRDLDTIREVAEAKGLRYAELSGRADTLEAWQNGEADVIGVNIRAGGLGVDLTRARVGIYFSQTFSLGDYEQSLDRIHRPGQEHPVVYYHLIATETVNEKVYHALRTKAKIVEAVMGAIKGGAEAAA